MRPLDGNSDIAAAQARIDDRERHGVKSASIQFASAARSWVAANLGPPGSQAWFYVSRQPAPYLVSADRHRTQALFLKRSLGQLAPGHDDKRSLRRFWKVTLKTSFLKYVGSYGSYHRLKLGFRGSYANRRCQCASFVLHACNWRQDLHFCPHNFSTTPVQRIEQTTQISVTPTLSSTTTIISRCQTNFRIEEDKILSEIPSTFSDA